MLRKPGQILTAAAVALLAIVFATALFAGTAGAAGCSRPTLRPASHQLVNGEDVVLAGTVCGREAQIMIKSNGSWQVLSSVRANPDKRFAKRIKVRVAAGVGLVELRAVSSHKASRPVRVRVSHQALTPTASTRKTSSGSTTTVSTSGSETTTGTTVPIPTPVLEHESVGALEPIPTPEPTPTPEPEEEAHHEEPTPTPEPEPAEGCALTNTAATTLLAMAIPACPRVASDTSGESNPLPFWGSIDCAESSRYASIATGGDEHDTAEGAQQGNTSYRQLTVENGDEFYGSRCELGFNNHERGPTAFYREGDHRVTYFSERLPSNFPINTSKWQTVMQMKQAQPQHDDGSGVALEMEVMNGRWYVLDHWNVVWSVPAQTGVWTRFAYDVYYSNDPSKGWLQVSVDLNGDGDFEDPGERSPVIHGATLATEIPGYPSDGVTPGTGIPSHLRIGIYHNPEISCPAPTGCSVDVDNVQVVAP